MSQTRLTSDAELLSEVADIFSVLVDPAVVPVQGSPADGELRAAQTTNAGTGQWGQEPIRAAYALATINYYAALEQAKSMAALMTGAFTAAPLAVLARSLIESASRAWWLLEPGIGVLARVERLLAARYASAVEGERAAKADGATIAEFGLYTETVAAVQNCSRDLGLPVPTRDGYVYVCGEQRLPSSSQRVIDMFSEIDVPSVYSLYSGFSHGEVYALRQAFHETTEPDGHHYYCPVINEEAVKGTVAMASWALYPSAFRFAILFGLDNCPATYKF